MTWHKLGHRKYNLGHVRLCDLPSVRIMKMSLVSDLHYCRYITFTMIYCRLIHIHSVHNCARAAGRNENRPEILLHSENIEATTPNTMTIIAFHSFEPTIVPTAPQRLGEKFEWQTLWDADILTTDDWGKGMGMYLSIDFMIFTYSFNMLLYLLNKYFIVTIIWHYRNASVCFSHKYLLID